MIKVKLEKRELEIKKLPLKKFSDLLKAFQKLPGQLNVFSGLSNNEIFSKLPDVIAESLPDFFSVFKIATDITDAELDEIGLDEAVQIFFGVLEENKIYDVVDRVKKGVARFQNRPEAAKNPTKTLGSTQH